MASAPRSRYRWLRFMMVLNGFAPLFVLWAIQGSSPFSGTLFIGFCILMILIPIAFIRIRIRGAQRLERPQPLDVGTSEDGRDHLLVYLFATLLPFYSSTTSSTREFVATLVALAFVLFLFWYLNLHYVNILFAVFGYRIYVVRPGLSANRFSGRETLVLISKRPHLEDASSLHALQLSDTAFLELDEGE